MIVRYDYIDEFFKQDTFTDVDLDNLRNKVEAKGYGNTERKSAMSLIDMHLVAYAMGSTLKSPLEEKKAHKKVNTKPKIERPVDKRTIEISEMLKKRGINEKTSKYERSQKYSGNKKTQIKIIYTRMS